MKPFVFSIAAFFVFGCVSAQVDTTSEIHDKTKQATQVRKEQNRDAHRNRDIERRVSPAIPTDTRPPQTPATTSTPTNNGSNKASGNAQPSTTPDATNIGRNDANSENRTNNPSGKP